MAGLRYAAPTLALSWLRGGEIRGLRTSRLPARSRFLGIAGSLLLIGLIAVAAALLQPDSPKLSGRATATDGDSLRLSGERVRLLGIDAPEYDQVCGDRNGANWRCGEAARLLLAGELGERTTECETFGRDRYGRVLARCSAGQGDLGRTLVAAGLAVTDGDYLVEQIAARTAGRGIWAGRFDLPSDWRARHGDSQQFDLLGWLKGLFNQLTGATKLR
ncbi:MAG TPA: thermonuclease family protein [Devosia sp.]|nr:thermonuclease family protein [Devosia sp.]